MLIFSPSSVFLQFSSFPLIAKTSGIPAPFSKVLAALRVLAACLESPSSLLECTRTASSFFGSSGTMFWGPPACFRGSAQESTQRASGDPRFLGCPQQSYEANIQGEKRQISGVGRFSVLHVVAFSQ